MIRPTKIWGLTQHRMENYCRVYRSRALRGCDFLEIPRFNVQTLNFNLYLAGDRGEGHRLFSIDALSASLPDSRSLVDR
jgi:hypothetical protein